jgi:hypothetical protein
MGQQVRKKEIRQRRQRREQRLKQRKAERKAGGASRGGFGNPSAS